MAENRAGGIWDTIKTLFYAVVIAVFIAHSRLNRSVFHPAQWFQRWWEITFCLKIYKGIAGTYLLAFQSSPDGFLAQSQTGGRRGF